MLSVTAIFWIENKVYYLICNCETQKILLTIFVNEVCGLNNQHK